FGRDHYSSSYHFTSYYSSRDSPSDSSSETSSDSHSNTSSISSTRHSSSGHPISDSFWDSPTAIFTGPSHKRCSSPTTSIHRRAMCRIYLEVGLGVDVEDSYKPYTKPDVDSDIQADIDAYIAFADDIAARETDVRVEDETAAEEEAESSARGLIEIRVDRVAHPIVSDDTTKPVREDYPDLVSADGSLEVMQRGLDVVMQELYDHMVEILVHRVRVIENV
ncbi:hypothetical protein Tco_1463543, partial [Tanacetum coccineum]